MKSEIITVQQMFQDRRQYRVPFYQRTYVWNKEDQWERLWSDIQDKASERLAGNQPVPHFLGAVVLEPQPVNSVLDIGKFSIIDGQQRLTTLQYLLAALSMTLSLSEETGILSLVENCRWNSNPETMKNPDIDVFKLWPTFRDRDTYKIAVSIKKINEFSDKFTDIFRKVNKSKKNSSMGLLAVEAILYFYSQIVEWIKREESNSRLILIAITEAILTDIKLVSITLGEEDDAQVIFETLNGHGAQLHATDLIRNYIFMQADRELGSASKLYDSLWLPFEDDFWKEEQTRGRLKRPRLDWFMQTILQVEFREEIDISRLYSGYQRFAKTKSATDQLVMLNTYAAYYKDLILGIGCKPIERFGRRIKVWDASTTHALALLICTSGLSDEEQNRIFDWVVSYLVRRAICGLTSKNYNRVFNQQVKRISSFPVTVDSIYADLSALEGKAARWPRDDEFQKEWTEAVIYEERLKSIKIKSIFIELEMAMRSSRTEESDLLKVEQLDIEHILPTSWFECWALSDGTFVKKDEIDSLNSDSPRLMLILKREKAKNLMGNLTLLNNGVNRSLQNSFFNKKRDAMFRESNLHLNRDLMIKNHWNESEIDARGQMLFSFAKEIWNGPEGTSEKSWFVEAALAEEEKKSNKITASKTLETEYSLINAWVVKNVAFPRNTEFRANHKGQVYRAIVGEGALVLSDGKEFSSPSSAARHITGTEVNGWSFWECKLPGESVWQVMGALRKGGK
ncbi:GmrSD restriction endonuclease domain-containing protein [Thiothrix lacustris]|uniref:GmrSD restriction endonuclease domain-containing protein n=1 Tax=Thiothrix lacustris TaxID=525917 RepID=UPI0027E503A5|nr:DUF262 domain-containing protein [Thiothrix lacustris]WMP17660.1 DUF262 domain-containing protein [Thiothrix lacustris]